MRIFSLTFLYRDHKGVLSWTFNNFGSSSLFYFFCFPSLVFDISFQQRNSNQRTRGRQCYRPNHPSSLIWTYSQTRFKLLPLTALSLFSFQEMFFFFFLQKQANKKPIEVSPTGIPIDQGI